MMSLETIKADLLHKQALKDLAEGVRHKKIGRGVDDIPVKRIIDAVDYIDKQLLPGVKKKSGDKSADFEFFTNIIGYLLYCIAVTDRYGYLENRWVHVKIENQLLREHMALMERELQKYNALEDLYMTDAMDIYAQRIKDAAQDRLNKGK